MSFGSARVSRGSPSVTTYYHAVIRPSTIVVVICATIIIGCAVAMCQGVPPLSPHTMDLPAAIVHAGRQSPELFQGMMRRLQEGDAFGDSLTYSQLLCIEGALEELREDECCAVDAALLEAEIKHLRREHHHLDKAEAINKRRQWYSRCGVLMQCLGGKEAVARVVLSNLYLGGELAQRAAPGPYTMTQSFMDPESDARWLWAPYTNEWWWA